MDYLDRYKYIKRTYYIRYDMDAVTWLKERLQVSRALVWATISGKDKGGFSPKVARFIEDDLSKKRGSLFPELIKNYKQTSIKFIKTK